MLQNNILQPGTAIPGSFPFFLISNPNNYSFKCQDFEIENLCTA